ncbi:hypothetical protein A8B78_04355 [Jannaschia sp. EhC01]|nr:hypothetical protein A8B78_04355 [Jannaschia sp. EhC01]
MADDTIPPEDPDRKTPEPEGGPAERARTFLEERLTPLKPKGEEPETPGGGGTERPPNPADHPKPASGDTEGASPRTESPGGGRAAHILPNRQRLIEQYRKRQRDLDRGAAPEAPVAAPPANNWIPIGPSVLRQGQGGVKPATSGRTPAIVVAPGGSRAYIGAANGGVWRTEDGGVTWTSLMDAFDLNPTQLASDSLACGALALVPGAGTATDRVYVGSGEGPGGAYFGVGPLMSTDGGTNWNPPEAVSPGSAGLAGAAFYALAVDPDDPDRVVGAVRDQVPNPGSLLQARIYRREPDGSGGFHWDQKVLPGHSHHWVTSVVVARDGGVTTFYAAPYFGPVYSSTDGDNWAIVGSGFPGTSSVGRISLAVQPDNASVIYAFSEQGDVYRLDTGDGTWRQVTGITPASQLVGSQGSYDLAIGVAPDNVNRIYLGGSTVSSGGAWSGAIYRSELTVSGASVTASNTYIGNSIHADIHTITFTPGNANQMWVGCDGGVFRSDTPTGSGDIFTSLNTGLQTLTLNYLGLHPTEDAVMFAGSQDNGGERYTGEEAWLYTSGGDSGYFIVNWDDPYQVLDTYVRGSVRRSTDGGSRGSYSPVGVPLSTGEGVLFYAPIAGTPPNPGVPADADVVAFGSVRPWISTTFGGGWSSIPNGNLAADSLGSAIKSMAFARANRLYVGTMNGGVYRFDQSGGSWTRTRLDTMGGANNLPLSGVVTAICVDPADATGSSIYITFGGAGDFRHVWHFNGTQWAARSGPSAGDPDALLDVQHNAVVVDPLNPTDIYVGADIGIWRSTDGGTTWDVFSDGLPDAAVLDMKLHGPRRILRASTHGRGAFERTLDSLPKQGVELYIRDTQLDLGRFTTVNYLPDPTDQGETVRHWRGPDIKLDTPDTAGSYQFPLSGDIDFLQFVDTLNDDSRDVATHATATITTKVYVQVHNRGVVPADNVRVMCLLANASAGLPNLPTGYEADVQSGTAITSPDWVTLGIVTLNDVRVGFPKIADFDLPSNLLPPPASLAGNDHHCVLALVHHVDDPYISTVTNTDANSLQERKSAHKNLKVVQFTGTLPSPPPVVIPFRIHSPSMKEKFLSDLVLNLQGYRGRVRLYLPKIECDGDLRELARGLYADQDFDPFKSWAEKHQGFIKENLRSKTPYNKHWSKQRLEDIDAALSHGLMFTAGARKTVALQRLILLPRRHHTLFLVLDRPEDGRIGERFDLEVMQVESGRRRVIGGLDLRIELQPEPKRGRVETASAAEPVA